MPPPIVVALLAAVPVLAVVVAWLLGRRTRPVHVSRRELEAYRHALGDRTARVDQLLERTTILIDALRRRDLDADEAVVLLGEAEEELDALAEELRAMEAPSELHGTHEAYEANLERALRGVVVTQRGCGLTKLPHRPPDDEEPFVYYRRGHGNVRHARMAMEELAQRMLAWTPAQLGEAEEQRRG